MRLKNVRGAREKIEASSYFLHEPERYRGKYNSLFKNNNPISLEIGMGKGNFIITMAQKYPDINFIGIEKYDSVLVRACEKLETLKLDNLYLISMDATNILDVFDKDIDTKEKKIVMKTDNRQLFEYSLLTLSQNNYVLNDISLNLHAEDDKLVDNVMTEYEQKFFSHNAIIYKVDAIKR